MGYELPSAQRMVISTLIVWDDVQHAVHPKSRNNDAHLKHQLLSSQKHPTNQALWQWWKIAGSSCILPFLPLSLMGSVVCPKIRTPGGYFRRNFWMLTWLVYSTDGEMRCLWLTFIHISLREGVKCFWRLVQLGKLVFQGWTQFLGGNSPQQGFWKSTSSPKVRNTLGWLTKMH